MYFYQLLFYTLYRNVLSLLSTIIFDWYFLLSDFFFLVAFTSNFIQVVSLQRCAYWLPLNLQQIKIVVKSSKSIKMHVKIINNIKKLHWKINILLLSHLLKKKKRKEKKLHIWSFHLQMNLLTYNYQLSPKLYHHTVVFFPRAQSWQYQVPSGQLILMQSAWNAAGQLSQHNKVPPEIKQWNHYQKCYWKQPLCFFIIFKDGS